MPTESESMPPVAGNAQSSNRPYLPSPPHTPTSSRGQRHLIDDGVADNTAAGMAEAQEHSMYQDLGFSAEGICNRDLEKPNPHQYATENSATAETVDSAILQAPASIEVDADSHGLTERSSPCPEESTTASMPSANVSLPCFLPTAREEPGTLFARTSTPVSIPASDPVSVPITIASEPLNGLTSEFTKIRLTPSSTSSFFRPGSKFTGTQQSDRQIYNVDVEILNVSIPESSVSGYLRICGLTDTHPTLTTYFEGEIIGTKHTFQTRHSSWGATDKTDMQHWARFPAWRPLAKEARRPGFSFGKGWWNREHIFMRWKEHFLVPDHRVRTIQGASFEGFYYICYNQIEKRISGIYFHAKSEKYQQLELQHVPDKGCLGAMEFR